MTIIGLIGRYGTGSQKLLPNWIDLLVVIAFSIVIFYYAVSLAMSSETIKQTIETEKAQIADEPELNIAG
jgi:hypothetical protein